MKLTSVEEMIVQCSGEEHLSTAHHAAPAAVGGDESVGDGREIGAIRHPRQRGIVVHELDNVRRDPFFSQLV